jgi:hypothetical protein
MPAKRYKVSLRPEERAYLHQVVSTGKAAAYKRTQAQILLQADQSDGGLGWTDQPMCDALHIGRVTGERNPANLCLRRSRCRFTAENTRPSSRA